MPLTVGLFEYEITHDLIPDPLVQALPREAQDRLSAAAEHVWEAPAECVGELEAIVAEFPHIPTMHNFLGIAYRSAGRRDDFECITRETYRLFPGYLFGVCNYALLCIQDGLIDEAAAALAGRFMLPLWYPDRRTFHVSEAVSLHGTLATYLAAAGSFDAALSHLKLAKGVEPDHPMIDAVERDLAVRAMTAGMVRLATLTPLVESRRSGAAGGATGSVLGRASAAGRL